MNTLIDYFIIFFTYSCIGWIIESTYCSLGNKKLILNRGFLIGPYIPIYGVSSVFMIFFLTEYKYSIFLLLCMSMVYSSLIEYLTSYVMEKVFKARWWDYSHQKYNLNGRICLKNTLLFGVCGVLLIKYLNPVVISFIDSIPKNFYNVFKYVILIIFIIDFVVSVFIVYNLKRKAKVISGDSTEEISEQVRDVINRGFLSKRMLKAFPKFRFTFDKSGEIINEIKNRFEEIDRNIENKKREIKNTKMNIKVLRKNKELDKLDDEKEKLKSLRRRK